MQPVSFRAPDVRSEVPHDAVIAGIPLGTLEGNIRRRLQSRRLAIRYVDFPGHVVYHTGYRKDNSNVTDFFEDMVTRWTQRQL
jgi:hypothetical protein